MAKRLTVQVTANEFEQLFQALEIWDKIRNGRLSTEEIPRRASPSDAWPGATSSMLVHRNSVGMRVATTHRIRYPDGRTPHWDASNLLVGDIVLYR